MPASPPLLQVHDLTIEFPTEQGLVRVVEKVSFSIKKGEAVAIVGESGSGKTLTALSLMQLLPPTASVRTGTTIFELPQQEPVDLLQLQEKQLLQVRGKEVSVVFQEPMSSLNPVMTCGKQVAEVLVLHLHLSKKEAYDRTIGLFELVKLPVPERIFNAYPHELSGGQKQRVMLAMAMACNPSLLIADEPTTALDVTVQAQILQLLNELRRQSGMAILFISHDLSVVAEVADRILVMHQGKIVEEGSVIEIFSQPKHPYTKALLACRPTMTTPKRPLPSVADFMEGRENPELLGDKAAARTVDKPVVNPLPRAQEIYREPLLQVKEVRVEFERNRTFFWQQKERITAVQEVSFDIYPGETVAIVGESGCGKTSLGRALLRLIKPVCGKIVFNNIEWANLTEEQVRQHRKDLQMIFQDPYASLNPMMKIGEAIMEPMRVHKVLQNDRERKHRALELLETVSLLPEHFDRYPHEFSGGQQQRICIARALALEPACIICDEIVSALDVSVQAQVLNLLNQLKQDFNLTLLFITHDLAVAKFMADRLFVMDKGTIVEQGEASELFRQPQHAVTKALLQAIPSGDVADILEAQRKRNTPKSSIDE